MVNIIENLGREIWFTSDTHYYSKNIIDYCYRPYNTVYEMNESMIENYNKLVNKGDTVYLLGDFCWSGRYEEVLRRLNGSIRVILGNHDDEKLFIKMKNMNLVQSVSDTDFIKINDDSIWLSHYPHRSWKNSFHGSYHLFGHMHNTAPNFGKSTDVGVDKWDYKPVHWEDLQKHLRGVKNEN